MESGFRSFSDLGMDDVVFFEESLEVRSQQINAAGSNYSGLHHENHLKRAAAQEAFIISQVMPPPPPLKQLKTLTNWNSSCNNIPSDERISSSNTNRDHCLAERKRREKLTQGFVTLSTLIPRLNKGDKISILGDAINYIKQLEEKVKALEEQTKKTAMEVFKLKRYGDDEYSSDESFPEIEARFCNKDVLINIHCQKRKGILAKVVAEIDKFQLSVVNSTVITYGDSAFNLTLIAERKDENTTTIKELVKNLYGVLR